MGKGFLKVELFAGDHVAPVSNVQVLVKDTKGNVLQELFADVNGDTIKITLEAPDKSSSQKPDSTMPHFSVYDVEIPNAKGYKKSIIHGVQIFDDTTAILPIQMHPRINGDNEEENTDEVFIPFEHGVDISRQEPEHNDYGAESINTMERVLANEVMVPQYITVHLGSPNAVAQNVRVPFIDYIKNAMCIKHLIA